MTTARALPHPLHDLYGSGSLPLYLLPLDSIDRDFRSVRFAEDAARVQMFAELILEVEDIMEFEPMIVVQDGRGGRRLADGRHRLLAALEVGLHELPSLCVDALGGMTAEQTARLVGARMSATASAPLKKAERKELARRLIADHPDWSDRRVARETGLDHKTVGRIHQVGNSPPERLEDEDHDPLVRAEDEAVAALGRFLSKLRAAALFDNVKTFRPRTARLLARALEHRFGDEASRVAEVIGQYFTEAGRALRR